jgi:hypothetical protein
MTPNKKSAAETYALPDWFLESNVTTSDEAADAQPKIRFRKEEGEDETWDDTWEGFYVSRDAYDGIHDTLPSLMVPIKGGSKQALVLYTGASGAGEFFGQLFLRLSQDLEMNLISTELTALENLAWDYESQDQKTRADSTSKSARADTTELSGPLQFYFGSEGSVATGNRSIKAFATLLGAYTKKIKVEADESSESKRSEEPEQKHEERLDERLEEKLETEGSETYEMISKDEKLCDESEDGAETTESKTQDAHKADEVQTQDVPSKADLEMKSDETETPQKKSDEAAADADKKSETQDDPTMAEANRTNPGTESDEATADAEKESSAADEQTDSAAKSMRPLLMHIHCSTEEFSDNANATFWTRLREAVARRGKSGHKCALVITIGRPPATSKERIPIQINGLDTCYVTHTATYTFELDNASLQELNPLHITKAMFEVPGFGRAHRPALTNYVRLEYVLRSKVASRAVESASCPVQALQDWHRRGGAAEVLGLSLWSGAQIFQAASQIIGRAHISDVHADDIQAVLERMKRLNGDTKVPDASASTKVKTMKERLDQIKAQCNEFEKGLLASVVNPGMMEIHMSKRTQLTIRRHQRRLRRRHHRGRHQGDD